MIGPRSPATKEVPARDPLLSAMLEKDRPLWVVFHEANDAVFQAQG